MAVMHFHINQQLAKTEGLATNPEGTSGERIPSIFESIDGGR
jgi:hypothetical protein